MRKLLTLAIPILLLALLSIPLVANADSTIEVTHKTGDGYWYKDTWQVDICPGETRYTTLTLYNPTDDRLEVRVRIIDLPDDNDLTFELSNTQLTIQSERSRKVTLTVYANNDAELGTYTAELEIRAKIQEEEEQDEDIEDTISPELPYVPPMPPEPDVPQPIQPEPGKPTSVAPATIIQWWWFVIPLEAIAVGACFWWLWKRRKNKIEEEGVIKD